LYVRFVRDILSPVAILGFGLRPQKVCQIY
jgi:hypothetical protein